MNTKPCNRCKGTGKTFNVLTEGLVTCHHCGGQRHIPLRGTVWYYLPIREADRGKPRCSRFQRIASLSRMKPSKWRLTVYSVDGPHYHMTRTAPGGDLMSELKGYHQTAVAPRLLDVWAARQPWQDGMIALQLVQDWNAGIR